MRTLRGRTKKTLQLSAVIGRRLALPCVVRRLAFIFLSHWLRSNVFCACFEKKKMHCPYLGVYHSHVAPRRALVSQNELQPNDQGNRRNGNEKQLSTAPPSSKVVLSQKNLPHTPDNPPLKTKNKKQKTKNCSSRCCVRRPQEARMDH